MRATMTILLALGSLAGCAYQQTREVSATPPTVSYQVSGNDEGDLVEAIRRHARNAHGIAFSVEDALLVVFRSQLDLSRESLTGETGSSRVPSDEGGER